MIETAPPPARPVYTMATAKSSPPLGNIGLWDNWDFSLNAGVPSNIHIAADDELSETQSEEDPRDEVDEVGSDSDFENPKVVLARHKERQQRILQESTMTHNNLPNTPSSDNANSSSSKLPLWEQLEFETQADYKAVSVCHIEDGANL